MKLITDAWHRSHGATFEDYFGCEIPSHYGSPEEEYWNLRKGIALRDVSFFGKVKITGKDAQTFLHRMVSNDIKSLVPGKGTWALFLDIKGHIQGDFKLYAFPSHLLMVLQHYVRDRVVQGLDRYVISEQVAFADVTEDHGMIQLLGPRAEDFLKSKNVTPPAEPLSVTSARIAEIDTDIIRLGAGFAVLCAASDSMILLDRLDAPVIGMRAFEVYRIEQGLSLLGKDVEETNFPQEGRMEGALNFQKGCYLGQEVMARIDAQGHVNKFLMGIVSDQPLAGGEKLYSGEKEVGKITSAAHSPMFQKTVALGYVRRELANEGQQILAGDNRTTVIVKALPMAQG